MYEEKETDLFETAPSRQSATLTITALDNGFTLRYWSGFYDDPSEERVIEIPDNDSGAVDAVRRLLYEVLDRFRPDGDSRYAKERIRVIIEPGDKYEGGSEEA